MFLLPWRPSQFTNGQSVFQISVWHADLLMLSYGGQFPLPKVAKTFTIESWQQTAQVNQSCEETLINLMAFCIYTLHSVHALF